MLKYISAQRKRRLIDGLEERMRDMLDDSRRWEMDYVNGKVKATVKSGRLEQTAYDKKNHQTVTLTLVYSRHWDYVQMGFWIQPDGDVARPVDFEEQRVEERHFWCILRMLRERIERANIITT